MIYCLEVEVVIALNCRFTRDGALRSRDGLKGVLARPMHTFGGQDLYPTVIEKAAALLHGIATTQHFIDGNKRTAWLACTTFMDIHGLCLRAEIDAFADDIVVDVANGVMKQEELTLWLLDHLEESG